MMMISCKCFCCPDMFSAPRSSLYRYSLTAFGASFYNIYIIIVHTCIIGGVFVCITNLNPIMHTT